MQPRQYFLLLNFRRAIFVLLGFTAQENRFSIRVPPTVPAGGDDAR